MPNYISHHSLTGSDLHNPKGLINVEDNLTMVADKLLKTDAIQPVTGGGSIAITKATINELGGALDAGGFSWTNVNIDSGYISGVNINGALTWSSSQDFSNVQMDNVNIQSGTINTGGTLGVSDVTASGLITANAGIKDISLTAGRVVFADADKTLTDDADFTFSEDTLTVSKIGAFTSTGTINFNGQEMQGVNITSGTINTGQTIAVSDISATGNITVTGTADLTGLLSADGGVSTGSISNADGEVSITIDADQKVSVLETLHTKTLTLEDDSFVFLTDAGVEKFKLSSSASGRLDLIGSEGIRLLASSASTDYADLKISGSALNISYSGGTIDVNSNNITNITSLTATTANLTNISFGGTSISATAAEINHLSGITSTTAELNVLHTSGVTTTELGYLSGSYAGNATQNRVAIYAAGGLLAGTIETVSQTLIEEIGNGTLLTILGDLNINAGTLNLAGDAVLDRTSAQSVSLKFITSIDSVTRATIESGIVYLPNLLQIQGQNITLGGPLTIEAAGSSSPTPNSDARINQDLTTDATGVQFSNLKIENILLNHTTDTIATSSGGALSVTPNLNLGDELILQGDKKIYWVDVNTYISGDDNELALGSDGTINMSATTQVSVTTETLGLSTNTINIGTNEDVDIALTFIGAGSSGVINWMEDEDYFKFSDDIILNSDENIYFRDTAIHINSSVDGQLDVDADTKVQINTATLDIDATTTTVSGSLDIEGDIDMATGKEIQWVDANTRIYGTTDNLKIESDGTVTIDSTTEVFIDTTTLDVDATNLEIGGTTATITYPTTTITANTILNLDSTQEIEMVTALLDIDATTLTANGTTATITYLTTNIVADTIVDINSPLVDISGDIKMVSNETIYWNDAETFITGNDSSITIDGDDYIYLISDTEVDVSSPLLDVNATTLTMNGTTATITYPTTNIVASSILDITSAEVAISGYLDIEGNIEVQGDIDIEGDIDMATGKKLTWIDDDVAIYGADGTLDIDSDGTITLDATTEVAIETSTLDIDASLTEISGDVAMVSSEKLYWNDVNTFITGTESSITIDGDANVTINADQKVTIDADSGDDDAILLDGNVQISGDFHVVGDTTHTSETNLDVTNKTISVNVGGSAGSGGVAGLLIEEAGAPDDIAGYIKTGAGAGPSWVIKAPANDDIFTIDTQSNITTLSTNSSSGMKIDNVLNVTGATDIDSTLNVDGDVTLNEDLTIGDASGDAVISNSGTWSFPNSTNINLKDGTVGALTFETDSLVFDTDNDRIGINQGTPTETLDIAGSATISSTLNTDGAVTFNSTLDVDGHTDLNSTTTIDGDTIIYNNLNITADNKMFTIETSLGADKFTVDTDNGNTDIKGTLNADGATTLNDELDVDGHTELNSTLNVDGEADFQDNVTINANNKMFKIQNNDDTDMFTVDTDDGNTYTAGTLDVTGHTNLDSTTTIDGATIINNSLTITADDKIFRIETADGTDTFTVDTDNGNTHIYGTLRTDGHTDLNSSATIDGDVILNEDLTIGDDANDIVTSNSSFWEFVNQTNINLKDNIVGALKFESTLFTLDTANNRIGIGTDTPTGRLDIGDGSGNETLCINKANASEGIIRFANTVDGSDADSWEIINDADKYLRIKSTGNTVDFIVQNGSTEVFKINPNADGTRYSTFNNCDVGIGTDTPAELLDIVGGNVRIEHTNDPSLIINGSSSTSALQRDAIILFQEQGVDKAKVYHYPFREALVLTDSSNDDLMFLKTGFVGIGTLGTGLSSVEPDTRLHVSTEAENVAKFESEDSDARIIIKDVNATTYIGAIQSTGNKMYLGMNEGIGATNVIINSSGHIGIGNTTPAQPLDVISDNSALAIFKSSTTTGYITVEDDATSSYLSVKSSHIYLGGTSGNSTNNVSITEATGFIGIGKDATVPLDITDYNDNVAIFHSSQEYISEDDRAYITISSEETEGHIVAMDDYMSIGGNSTLSAANLNIHEDSGYVGIGTVSPDSPLHIYYDDDTTESGFHTDTDVVGLKIENNSTTGVAALKFKNRGHAAISSAYIFYDCNDNDEGDSGDLHFRVSDNDEASAMTIYNDGNIGIGIEDPTEALDIVGNTTMSGDLHVDGNDITFGNGEFISNSLDGTLRFNANLRFDIDSDSSISFQTRAGSGGGSKLTIKSQDAVGDDYDGGDIWIQAGEAEGGTGVDGRIDIKSKSYIRDEMLFDSTKKLGWGNAADQWIEGNGTILNLDANNEFNIVTDVAMLIDTQTLTVVSPTLIDLHSLEVAIDGDIDLEGHIYMRATTGSGSKIRWGVDDTTPYIHATTVGLLLDGNDTITMYADDNFVLQTPRADILASTEIEFQTPLLDLNITGTIDIDSPLMEMSGDIDIEGDIDMKKNSKITWASDLIHITGSDEVTGDYTANHLVVDADDFLYIEADAGVISNCNDFTYGISDTSDVLLVFRGKNNAGYSTTGSIKYDPNDLEYASLESDGVYPDDLNGKFIVGNHFQMLGSTKLSFKTEFCSLYAEDSYTLTVKAKNDGSGQLNLESDKIQMKTTEDSGVYTDNWIYFDNLNEGIAWTDTGAYIKANTHNMQYYTGGDIGYDEHIFYDKINIAGQPSPTTGHWDTSTLGYHLNIKTNSLRGTQFTCGEDDFKQNYSCISHFGQVDIDSD